MVDGEAAIRVAVEGDAEVGVVRDDGCLQSVARGQEFVTDIGERKDARDWLAGVIAAIEG